MASASVVTVIVLVAMLLTYVVCGIPFGLIFGKSKGVDVRTKGSGNIGTTNVAREVGAGVAVATLVCDVLKGFVCTFFGSWAVAALAFGGDTAAVLPGGPASWVSACLLMAAVLGHVFSPYLKFRGGKGIAVGLGAALGISWPLALGLGVVWALCTVPTRIVSVGSVIGAVALPILALFVCQPVTLAFEAPLVLTAIVVVWAHRSNLQKLRTGEENRFAVANGSASDTVDEALAAQREAQTSLDEAGEARPVSPAAARARAVTAERAAADEAAGTASVATVEEAAEEAAEADAAKLTAPGEGLVFGDEDLVTQKVAKVRDEVEGR